MDIKNLANVFRLMLPIFQNDDIIVFQYKGSGNFNEVALESLVEDIIKLLRIDYPKLGYSMVNAEVLVDEKHIPLGYCYLVITKLGDFHNFYYGDFPPD
jgi:hypothetical protein